MSSRIRLTALAFACLAAVAAPAASQDVVPDGDTARFHFGPLGLTPSIVVSNVGVDNNVFNDAVNPKSDTTATIGPASDVWLGVGTSRLKGNVGAQYLWFDQYDNQRGWNLKEDGRWDFPLSRFTPYVTGSYTDTKDRPGFEIDSRARRTDSMYGVGTAVRFSGRTSIELGVKRSWSRYDENQTYDGVELSDPLNHRSDSASLNLKFKLTPLTTFVIRNEAVQDRFDVSTVRDTDSYSVMPGFEIRPGALISGQAFVGVRHFKTLDAALPDYTGVVALVKTQYIVRGTRVTVHVARDLSYSYLDDTPYYALTDSGFELTQRVTFNWDVVARSSWQTLAYQALTTGTGTGDTTDHAWMGGAGVGYRIGHTLRVGVDANYYRRQSQVSLARSYEGLRAGASISYGLPQ
jgi:hypothetical protein